VIDRKENPPPKDLEIEIGTFLACLVNLWVPVHVLVVDVLLEGVGEEAGPGRPECIVKGLKPVSKEDLARKTIAKREKDFCENKDDVFVEVVAHDPADSSVAPSSVNQ
jgi:hypothetical protein